MKLARAGTLALLAISLEGADSVCLQCHRMQAEPQPKTSMAHALESAAECDILKNHPRLTFRNQQYSYTISREQNESVYTVTDGKDSLSVPIAWAFGLGAAGQTYVFERNGNWYESRVSFYKALDGLDLTMGERNAAAKNIGEAAGRQMNVKEAGDCFRCHSTNATPGGTLDVAALSTGVRCERCHAAAEEHVRAVKAGDIKHAAMKKLSAMTTEETSEFCGGCHRTWSDIATNGPRGTLNVRFQPYRLTNSKCYDAADKRISCTACHDPHRNVARAAKFYDSKCGACHGQEKRASGVKACPRATQNCVSCHMPKIELPGSHFAFTDHQIRIARAGEPYPN